ncbi:hypothetical protein OUZ56_031531 [Daphnia magna]|uniref:Uncharacterized protein n=1 Tax=Daphnia magna TaxID=35525 RepID=A0ABQ9ZUY9_9CRUS|nr:hypothetical protein OUZ56_031531 [Daphnia magna]
MDAGTTMGGQLNTRNDGSSSPFSQLMQEGYAESCEGEMETNLTGIFFCTKSLSPHQKWRYEAPFYFDICCFIHSRLLLYLASSNVHRARHNGLLHLRL